MLGRVELERTRLTVQSSQARAAHEREQNVSARGSSLPKVSIPLTMSKITVEGWKVNWNGLLDPYKAGGSPSPPPPPPPSSSSSTQLDDDACFRIYSKGLLSEEWVKEKMVDVAGIGVAICDCDDNVMLEMRKPVRNPSNLSAYETDIEALVQGLDAAVRLNLKRVFFVIDDENTRDIVMDSKPHVGDNINRLVSQANQLMKMFTHCEPCLSPGLNDKFCYKLARGAIISRLSWTEKTPIGKKRRETCIKCFECTNVSQMFSVDGCLHRCCFSCTRNHIEEKLRIGMVITCPQDGCKYKLVANSCKKFLPPNLVSLMNQRMEEDAIPREERVYCPYPRCSALMRKREVLKHTEESFAGAGCRKCMKCQLYFCIDCKAPWLRNMSCRDYRETNPDSVASLANENMWRQCKRCNHMVERVDGCYHMTCRCGYEFCYLCGADWKNRKLNSNCRHKRDATKY